MAEIRFEWENSRAAAYDGEILAGECDVVMQKSFWIITHTEVDRAYSGQGIAKALVDCVLDAAGKTGVKVKPFCGYAAHVMEETEEYKEMEDQSVITMYGMKTCPDCQSAEAQTQGREDFKIVDIGEHVRNMKEFIRLRDSSPAFDEAKKNGSIGIPCFVLEDGTITLDPKEVGLKDAPETGAACSIDGKGC